MAKVLRLLISSDNPIVILFFRADACLVGAQ
jgi:hypothetical protein